MAGGAPGERSLAETPTWAVAGVCAIFVFISVMIEHLIHILTKWFQKRQKKAMSEALEKIKAELMLLGFISLLLTVGTPYVADICMAKKFAGTMLPCYNEGNVSDKEDESEGGEGDRRRLLSYDESEVWRRVLAGAGGTDKCLEENKVALVSQSALHQLHIFIFVLAVLHILYSGITMALSQAKMKKWKAWESETSSMEYQFNNDPERFRFAHQTSFVRRHSGLSRLPGIKWIVAFLRQFFGSISKVDYMTMRHGFINAHLAPNSKFDFHKYIKRSMEDDFKVVVGISIPLWVFAIIFLLLNVYKWHTFTYLAVVPLAILLLVGTKLELIIMEMAQSIQDRSTVVRGAPLVEPSNEYFWFKQPKWVLFLIHFTLFQNAFQMAYFLWIFYEFGLKSCFHENLAKTFARVLLGVASQILCSYITFPLYALVTQMGSHMKRAIFEEQTAKALMKWQKAAREKSKLRKAGVDVSNSGYLSGETTPSHGTSPLHLLHKYRSSLDAESVATSPVSYLSDTELSELEVAMQGKGDITRQEASARNAEPQNVDFSFVTP